MAFCDEKEDGYYVNPGEYWPWQPVYKKQDDEQACFYF